MRRDATQLAEKFCELNDEDQAQFFIEVARIMETWIDEGGSPGMQKFLIGRHLRTCSCSTYEARAFIEDIAEGMKT